MSNVPRELGSFSCSTDTMVSANLPWHILDIFLPSFCRCFFNHARLQPKLSMFCRHYAKFQEYTSRLLVPWSPRSCIDIIATTSLRFLRERRTKLPVLEFSFTKYLEIFANLWASFSHLYFCVLFPDVSLLLTDDPVRVAGTNELTDAWGLPVH